jgi:serine/threonine protein kinase/formylglycine-generating enzyme required for sulfatase activity
MTRPRSTTWSPPQEFAEYRVVRVLGEGAMGKVFLAHDTVLDRPVAVKFLGSRDLGGLARDRFLIEARALARLHHPNVVAVYRVGELGRRPYLVSEFVHGKSLDKVDKPMASKQVLELAIGLARGLSAAHRRGVLHRDIKPGNTILTDTNEVKLLDFGLAKFTDSAEPFGATTNQATPSGVERPRLTPVPPEVAARELDPFEATHDINRTANLPDLKPAVATPVRAEPAVEDPQPATAASSPSLTRDGALMGTPYYMAPEIWRAEPASERSDIYSLGALLYELLAGHPPHRSQLITELAGLVQDKAAAPLPDTVSPALAAIVMRCLARDPSARFTTADELRTELETLHAPRAAPTAIPEGNPYPGLQAFEAAQQSLFFGRDADVRAVVERLRTDNFVVVAGDSGTGKSSVCHAGVGPAVASGALGDGRTWQTVTMHPGRRPILSLVTTMTAALGLDSVTLENALVSRDGAALVEQRRAALRSLGTQRGVLLILDHLEELVTIAGLEETSAVGEFLTELLAARSPGFRVLGAVRGDYLTQTANLPALGDHMARALYMLRPMTAEGIAQAIVGPLRAKGGRFEPESMVDELVAEAQTRGGLPLVQFALAELWSARTADNMISGEALRSLGGVAGALTRHADSVIAGLRDVERKAASRMLLALIAADGTRTQRTREELVADDRNAESTLEALLKGRLIAIREDEGAPTYEIAHDALIQRWDRLRRWLDDDGERRIVRRRIEDAGDEWQRLGHSPELLWRDRQLPEADRVAYDSLGEVARAFLDSSRTAVRRARIRRLAVAIGIPLAIIAVVVFVRMRIQTASDERIAEEQRERDQRVAMHVDQATKILAGSSGAIGTLREQQQHAFAQFDARELATAEAAWATVLQRSRELDGTFSLSSQELEHALVIDTTRDDVRKKLAEILNERAHLADDFHNAERREELLRRLALYDTTGTFVATWNAPATLSLQITPATATVVLAAVEREGTRRIERPARPIAPNASIAPGDYVLIASAPGHAEVRFPLRAKPGETLPIAFALPASAAIPAGLIYIPPGRFLVGTADEGARTSFLSTVPLHEARTDEFLIAKYETTFGEWIAFLDALPADQREKLRPRSSGAQSMSGQIDLSKQDERWTLTLQPTTQTYTAKQGDPIRYLDRTTRAEQDWSKLPVIGVSLEDFRAYAAWLDAKHRVPHARACTELEWERAARGADDREFPHGDTLAVGDANFDETYSKQPRAFGPDEVGSHPLARSPFGIDDMAGNAFEWTVASLSSNAAAIRGGAFYFGALTARATNRNTLEPSTRSVQLGIRVCADAPK